MIQHWLEDQVLLEVERLRVELEVGGRGGVDCRERSGPWPKMQGDISLVALRLAVRETGLPPPPILHQNPRLAPRTAHQHAQTDFSIFGPCWPRVYINNIRSN